jgi:hypothetical protein
MTNKHIKVINGRKYYYESIRVGKKVTSRYIGPVDRIRKRKVNKAEQAVQQVAQEMDAQAADIEQEAMEQGGPSEDENYIG